MMVVYQFDIVLMHTERHINSVYLYLNIEEDLNITDFDISHG